VDHAARRAQLAQRFDQLGVDSFLVTRLPNVRYLTGFTGTNGQLLMDRQGGVFLTDGRYVEQSRHEVPDLRRASYSGEFGPAFSRSCAELGVLRVAFESSGLTFRTHHHLTDAEVELVPTEDEVERIRWVKSPEEVAFLDEAQSIADDAFDVVVGKLAEGMAEREVAFELDTCMRRSGAEALAFESIVAFGENAAEPHHNPGGRRLDHGDVVKMDFGCVVGGYHSDMTRTLAFGRLMPELERVYDVVRRAQQAGIDAVRAGATGADVDRAARTVVQDGGYGDRFTHGLGHGVGLEIHEGPSLRAGGEDVLPAGAVVTVEPGVYVPGVGGVRIEDMVEVQGDGSRVIPRSPKDLLVL
jgi:Xaa-Pro aminopeptidase